MTTAERVFEIGQRVMHFDPVYRRLGLEGTVQGRSPICDPQTGERLVKVEQENGRVMFYPPDELRGAGAAAGLPMTIAGEGAK